MNFEIRRILQGISLHICNPRQTLGSNRELGEKAKVNAACHPEHDVVLGVQILINCKTSLSDKKVLRDKGTLHMLNPLQKLLKLQTIDKKI